MALVPWLRSWLRLGASLAAAAALLASCKSDLSESVEGLDCGSQGECLPGYECDSASNTCVLPGSITNPPGECRADETLCPDGCVSLADNELNCRACGTICSAPLNAAPVCVDRRCTFACQDGFLPCGTSCVDTTSDIQNCGACGHACPAPLGSTPVCDEGSCAVACDLGHALRG